MSFPKIRHVFRRLDTVLVVAVAMSSMVAVADRARASEPRPVGRSIPDGCLAPGLDLESDNRDEARWNRLYLEGVEAIGRQDLDLGLRSFCAALGAARDFGPRDWRFAETLDELGLVAFMSGDLQLAEQMQGAAVAEMLLAMGPEESITAPAPGRDSRRSSVAIYAGRLRLICEKLGKEQRLPDLSLEPYRILELGYLPMDEALAKRLDWLISRYLLAESFGVAKRLERLRAEIGSR